MKAFSTSVLGAGIAAAAVVATASMAGAQLPGVDNTTMVFPIDDERIQISVDPADVDAGTVRVSIQNNTAQNVNCQGRDGAAAGAVTPADITAKSVDFYAKYPHSDLAELQVGIDIDGFASSLSNLLPQLAFDLGSVQGLLPGSVAGYYDEEWGALAEIGEAYSEARLAGQVGLTANSLSLPAGNTTVVTVPLGHTSIGDREAFQAGFFMTCELGGQRYVFHGYDGDAPQAEGTDEADTGSLGGLNAGSLTSGS